MAKTKTWPGSDCEAEEVADSFEVEGTERVRK